MAILANRVKIRNNVVDLGKFVFLLIKKTSALIIIIISCCLLYFSTPKPLTNILLETTSRFLSVGSLIYQQSILSSKWAYKRLSYFKDLEAENLRLKIELASLEGAKKLSSHLHLENIKLRKMLNVTTEMQPNFITARIIGTSITPFASVATIYAGTENGINVNDVVRGTTGLVGRISEVSANSATVMLINDHNSRIPVITGTSKVRGILAKQDDHLKMIYLKDDHDVTNGEIIYTSGDGKIYPKGIAVATIENITNKGVFVQNIESFNNLEFVIVESKSN